MIVSVMLFVSLLAGNTYGQATKAIIPSIGGKTNGTTISKSALVNAGKIAINSTTKKVNFFMMSYMNNLNRVELSSNSENLTQEMKTAINGLPANSVIMFIKISCKSNYSENAAPERVGEFTVTLQ